MKYIDSEKLIAEIERLNSLVSYESKDRHDEGLHDAYKAVKNVIRSLQQEQLENEEKIMNFFDALGDCGFSQHDILLLKNIWKDAGCQPPKSQVADASKMEHPEVDLEKEIDEYCGKRKECPVPDFMEAVAYHFYELGLNARKK